jgi:hypothetical protein
MQKIYIDIFLLIKNLYDKSNHNVHATNYIWNEWSLGMIVYDELHGLVLEIIVCYYISGSKLSIIKSKEIAKMWWPYENYQHNSRI